MDGTASSVLNRSAAPTATQRAVSARVLESVAADSAGQDRPAGRVSRCQGASTDIVTNLWSASACRGILGCCARHQSAPRAATASGVTAGVLVNAGVRLAGLDRHVLSATAILGASTAPAIDPGSVSASKVGAVCCVMKNSTTAIRTRTRAKTAVNVNHWNLEMASSDVNALKASAVETARTFQKA